MPQTKCEVYLVHLALHNSSVLAKAAHMPRHGGDFTREITQNKALRPIFFVKDLHGTTINSYVF